MPAVVDDARAFLGRTLTDVQRTLGPDAEPIPGDEYGRMEDVTSIRDAAVFPGTLFLLDGEVELVYVDGEALPEVTPADLTAQLGDGAVALRSRAGKRANLWVHAEQGVAFSAQDDTLDFLEVFRPRSQAAYEAEIYREPHAFIR